MTVLITAISSHAGNRSLQDSWLGEAMNLQNQEANLIVDSEISCYDALFCIVYEDQYPLYINDSFRASYEPMAHLLQVITTQAGIR